MYIVQHFPGEWSSVLLNIWIMLYNFTTFMLQIVDNSPASQGKIKAISQQLLKLKLSVQNEVGVTYEAIILVTGGPC